MAKTDFQSVDEYHAVFPADIQKRMSVVREIIHQVVPTVSERISYQVPCFSYKGALVYYAAYSKHLSLSYPFSDAFLKEFSEELSGYTISKSVIQIPHDHELPVDFIRRIVAFRMRENEQIASSKQTVNP